MSSGNEQTLAYGFILLVFWRPILNSLRSGVSTLLKFTVARFGALIRLILIRNQNDPIAVKLGKHTIPSSARLRHSHIVGATGSGKTVLIEHLLFQDLKNGLGAMIIDPKGDRELYERVKSYCHSIGRRSDLYYLSATHPEESHSWNPCQLGNASNLQTKFFNANTFSEPHYAKACEKGLLRAFDHLLRTKPSGFNFLDLVREIETLGRDEKNNTLEGLSYDFYNLAQGEWKSVLLEENHQSISLLDITRRNQILFVDLPTEASSLQSARIGKLLLQEMMLISGLRKSRPELKPEKPFSIYIDEFDAFASESFVTFLNKGRSSGFMIHLAHQTLSDLRKVSEHFPGQVMGNTNARFVFRQDEPKDAETWAKFFGTRSAVKTTWQTKDGSRSGMESNREVQEFRVSPDRIKELKTGECVVSIKTERILETLSIPAPQPIKLPKFILDRISSKLPKMEMKTKKVNSSKFQFSTDELRLKQPTPLKGAPQ